MSSADDKKQPTDELKDNVDTMLFMVERNRLLKESQLIKNKENKDKHENSAGSDQIEKDKPNRQDKKV